MTDPLAQFRKPSGIAFMTLPGRNFLAPAMPYVRLSLAFAIGVVATILLLELT